LELRKVNLPRRRLYVPFVLRRLMLQACDRALSAARHPCRHTLTQSLCS
jgi:hypothetical protein